MKRRSLNCKDFNMLSKLIIEHFPRPHSETDPYKVLITTILSQRSRDENTNVAAKQLFEVYNNIEILANLNPTQLYDLIKPAGLYKEKAERIVQVSRIILEEYNGVVPDTLEKLLRLPGVGRKTANIVLYVGFGRPALAVDTHVHRISNRLGWVNTKRPEDTEEQLTKILDPELWGPINGSMVEFGKNICKPVSPKCEICFLKDCCRYYSELKR
ncbi:MAG: endonuclease III [Fervidobacterium sp.]|uniref:Endonuclease III n=1 Tax=Fervidobacterium gondwanense DSM 13020 TaxID=1121883 RepID=A0A1M7S5L9_FERGO|nr:endonuclease III [Fervidobacterium gondwanense]SHN53632.1 DNA-(apurinic or apyrimidinic site) lyase /endonuclease III [Fervidobacterium gondwanense DSM 13020]